MPPHYWRQPPHWRSVSLAIFDCFASICECTQRAALLTVLSHSCWKDISRFSLFRSIWLVRLCFVRRLWSSCFSPNSDGLACWGSNFTVVSCVWHALSLDNTPWLFCPSTCMSMGSVACMVQLPCFATSVLCELCNLMLIYSLPGYLLSLQQCSFMATAVLGLPQPQENFTTNRMHRHPQNEQVQSLHCDNSLQNITALQWFSEWIQWANNAHVLSINGTDLSTLACWWSKRWPMNAGLYSPDARM